MSTTSLFVELIVIGAGAFVWVALLAAAVCGLWWLPLEALLSPGPLVALLPFVYLLGILTDRVADKLLNPWDKKLRFDVYRDDEQRYFDDHRDLRTGSPELSAMLDYGRSRMRICRGWVLNGALIAVAWCVFVVAPHDVDLGVEALPVALVFLGLAVLCLWVWRGLSKSEYEKVERQSEYVRDKTLVRDSQQN